MSRFNQDREEEAREARLTSQTEAFQRWLAEKHPEIHFCTALLAEAQDYMQDSFYTSSDEDWEYAIQNIDTSGVRQHVPTPQETKQSLINKIMERLQATNNLHWSDEHNRKTERTKMSFFSLEQLTQRLDGVIRSQELSRKSPVELKQIVEAGRTYVGFPKLGRTVVPAGSVHAVPQDSNYLKSLDAFSLKRLCRLYGVDQVNNRLAGND